MKKPVLSLLLLLMLIATESQARNDIKDFSLADAFALDAYDKKLGSQIKFYFGNQQPGKVVKVFGTWPTLKKTNAFNKSDEFACQWALLSALLSLKKRALKEGGNAVINIVTNNNHEEKSSATTFECEVGNIIASVALKGKVVTVE